MIGDSEGSRGVTVIEVIVALAVFTVNALAISGLLLVAIDLTRTVEAVARTLEEGVTLPDCVLLLAPPLRSVARRRRSNHAGFTLVEVLVALALSGVVLVLASGLLTGSLRTSAALTARAVDQEARIAIPAILGELLSATGAGVGSAECALGVSGDGRVLTLTRAEPDGTLRVDEVFAATDGGGRPALYLRHRPHARQPWLEEVTAFDVVRVHGAADGRVDSVELRVVHAGASRPIEVVALLPHRPCLAEAP